MSVIRDLDMHIRAAELLVADIRHDQQHFVPEFEIGVPADALNPVLELLPKRPPAAFVEFLSRVTLPKVAPRAAYKYTLPKGRIVNSTRDYHWLSRYSCTPLTADELLDHQTGSAPAIYILAGGLLGFAWYFNHGDGDMIAYDTQTGMILNVDVGASYEPDEQGSGIWYSRVWGSIFEFVEEHVVRKQSYPPISFTGQQEDEYWKDHATDPKHVGPLSETAMFQCACTCNNDGLEKLLKGGADLEHRNSLKQTPLLYICSQRFQFGLLKRLLEYQPNENAIDTWGNTPIMLAARNGEVEYVKALLDAGADKNLADPFGRQPMGLVSRFDSHREEMISLLQ